MINYSMLKLVKREVLIQIIHKENSQTKSSLSIENNYMVVCILYDNFNKLYVEIF